MGSLSKLEGAVKRKLGYPRNLASNVGDIAEAALEVVDEKVTELNLSREPWYLAKARIDVYSGEAVYLIDNVATGFDKARYLYTFDESDPTYNRRPVELVAYESLTSWYQGGDPALTASASHSAIAASIYYDVNRGNVLEFAPIPQTSATYMLVYEVAPQRPQARTDSAFRFSQFDGYIADCVALRLLPLCEWPGLDDEQSERKRQAIAGSESRGYGLVVDVAKGDARLWKWKHSGKNPSQVTSIGFGQGRW